VKALSRFLMISCALLVKGGLMVVDYGEFKGNKLIILKRNEQDNFPFQFGKGKAKLIVENFDAIKKFSEEE
jgi:hypothetical protein